MDEILNVKADMAMEPNDADVRVRAGVEARVRNATAKLPELETKYRAAIKDHVVLIGIVGAGAKEFANIAKYVYKTAIADFSVLNHKLQANFMARSARMDFNNQESYMLLDELAKLKLEYGILSLPNPTFNIGSVNLFGENTFKVIDMVLRHNYGNQLHTVALLNEIHKTALASHFGGKLLPVIVFSDEVTTESMAVDETVLPRIHKIFEIGAVVTDETVAAVLEDVKKSLKVVPSQVVVAEAVSVEEKKEVEAPKELSIEESETLIEEALETAVEATVQLKKAVAKSKKK